MKVKCIHHDLVQDKYTGEWYEPNKEYEVMLERAKELIASTYFEAVEDVEKPVEKPVKKKRTTKKD